MSLSERRKMIDAEPGQAFKSYGKTSPEYTGIREKRHAPIHLKRHQMASLQYIASVREGGNRADLR